MLDPNLKCDILYDLQEKLIARWGQDEFMRRLNGVLTAINQALSDKYPDIDGALVAVATDALSMKLIENSIAKVMRKKGEAN